jgi:methionine-rich copper-binding protein CopC
MRRIKAAEQPSAVFKLGYHRLEGGPMESWAVQAFKRLVVGTVMATAMCADVTPALAHAALVKTEPPRRAIVAKAPAQVQLWFNEEIESAYASLVVLDTGKNPVTEAKPQLASNDLKSIVLPLPELAPGKYSVRFRVLSLDGHVIQSSFDFTVKDKLQAK